MRGREGRGGQVVSCAGRAARGGARAEKRDGGLATPALSYPSSTWECEDRGRGKKTPRYRMITNLVYRLRGGSTSRKGRVANAEVANGRGEAVAAVARSRRSRAGIMAVVGATGPHAGRVQVPCAHRRQFGLAGAVARARGGSWKRGWTLDSVAPFPSCFALGCRPSEGAGEGWTVRGVGRARGKFRGAMASLKCTPAIDKRGGIALRPLCAQPREFELRVKLYREEEARASGAALRKDWRWEDGERGRWLALFGRGGL